MGSRRGTLVGGDKGGWVALPGPAAEHCFGAAHPWVSTWDGYRTVTTALQGLVLQVRICKSGI